ncbi:MAG TPA: DUF4367 domain-containing protein [Candidatus Saccharimonadales bacterium]|nr:DUF4367 domain-containing protein [Candidatus Saccharimonadales bacterium]
MSRAASIIEINGTRYDANSGNVVGAVKKVATQVKGQSKVIDGFVRKSGSAITKAPAAVVKAPAAVIPKRTPAEPRQAKLAHQVHNRTQRSNALMRNIVSKPKAQIAEVRQGLIKPSVSKAVGQEQERRARAVAIPKHSRVDRFGVLKTAETKPRHEITAKARPVVQMSQAVSAPAVAKPLPSMVVSASHQKLERLLDEALIRADAHKAMERKRSRNPLNHITRLPRWLVVSILLIIVIAIVGFFAWRDIPQVALKVAGEQAHVSASLPDYAPTGFSIAGPASHQGNTVVIKYQSGGYSYDITQKSSGWDSTSLAANVITPGLQVQTSQVQGTTVYIYGKQNNATWVNNGVWYTLKNNASLTSDQIMRIVQSM